MLNPFPDACGASGPLLIGIESPGVAGVETRAFDLPFVLVGHDPRTDLRLDHPAVDGRHAYLQLVNGQLVCVDLGSRTGVFHGGVRHRTGFLERGRAVRIGPYRVRLVAGDAGPDRQVAPADDRQPRGLEILHRSVRRTTSHLPDGLALVGNAADCQIRLVDPSVSNYHCSLIQSPLGVWVVDLLGEGGVRVNGREVSYARLHEGDALQVGHSVIRLAAGPTVADTDTADTARVTPPTAVAFPAGPPPAPEPEPGPEPVVARPSVTAAFESEGEFVERVLAPVVVQVGQLQRQMAEEFEQARALMAESFAALRREQSSQLEQELEEVRRLGRELRRLRGEVERQARDSPDHAPTDHVENGNGHAHAHAHSRLGSVTPAPSRALVLSTTVEPADASPTRPNGRDGRQGRLPSVSARPDAATRVVPQHEEQAHAALCRRIVNSQYRHQSLWEKMLSLFPGALKGKTTL